MCDANQYIIWLMFQEECILPALHNSLTGWMDLKSKLTLRNLHKLVYMYVFSLQISSKVVSKTYDIFNSTPSDIAFPRYLSNTIIRKVRVLNSTECLSELNYRKKSNVWIYKFKRKSNFNKLYIKWSYFLQYILKSFLPCGSDQTW